MFYGEISNLHVFVNYSKMPTLIRLLAFMYGFPRYGYICGQLLMDRCCFGVDILKMFCLNEKLLSYNRLDSCKLDNCIDRNKSDNFFEFMSRKGFLSSVKSCMLDTHTRWRQLTKPGQ